MVKSTAKKLMALLLSALLLFSAFGGALSVFAEDESTEDVYGTSASGFYSKNDGKNRKITTTDGPKNFDFSEGFKYWSSKADKTGYASDMLVMETDENGSNYIHTVTASDVVEDEDGNPNYTLENYKGIESAPFTIASQYAGKAIYLIAKYKRTQAAADAYIADKSNSNARTGDLQLQLFSFVDEVQEDGSTKTVQTNKSWQGFVGDNHIAAGVYNVRTWGTALTVDPEARYVLQIQDGSNPANNKDEEGNQTGFKAEEYTQLSEMIFAVANDDGSYTNIATGEKIYKNGDPYGGTEDEGIVVSYYDDNTIAVVDKNKAYRQTDVFAPTTGLQNADFSNGFKFWTLKQYEKDKIPEVLSIAEQASVENGVVSFKAVSKEGYTLYPGISSCLFSIPGIKAGDKLVLTVEQRNAQVELALKEFVINGTNNYASGVSDGEKSSGTKGNTTASWYTVVTPELTVANDNALFGIYLQRGQSTAGQIRNFRIYKVTDDGNYIDVTNGYDADNSTVIDNKNGGTEKDGILEFDASLTSSVTYTNAYSKMMNGDFSEGLKYWSVKTDKTGYASAVATVTADGAVVTNDRYDGLKSPTVVVPDSLDGKTLAVRVGFNSYETDSFEFRLYVNGIKQSISLGGDLSNNVKFTNVTLSAGDKLTVEFQGNATEGSKFLIKYVDFCTKEDDNSYLSFDGVTRYAHDGLNAAAPLGGTEEDGLYSDTKWSSISGFVKYGGYATQGLQNGDFSEGFKYWRLRYSTADQNLCHYLSEQASVDKATGIVSFKQVYRENDATLYAGLISSGFYLNSLKANDTVYAALDFRGATSNGEISVGLRAYNTETGTQLQMYNYTKDDGTEVYDGGEHWGSTVKNTDTEAWKTVYSKGVTTDGENIVFSAHMQRYYNSAEGEIANFRILRADRGGLENAPKVNLDGTLDTAAGQLYGDANNDGTVDLIDLVRMKKYASDSTSNGIFLAAVDMDNDDVINASDLTAVVKAIIDPTYKLSK